MSIQGEERRYRGREKNNGKGATFSFGGARVDQPGIMAERARTPNLMPKCSWVGTMGFNPYYLCSFLLEIRLQVGFSIPAASSLQRPHLLQSQSPTRGIQLVVSTTTEKLLSTCLCAVLPLLLCFHYLGVSNIY